MVPSNESSKPHVVCVPYPSQGHIGPFMKLANILHSEGFHITFVNTEFNHRRFIRTKGTEFIGGLEDFKFETIPDGLPSSDRDATQDVVALCDSTRKNCSKPFKELIVKLNSSSEVPPVSCVISDGVMSFAIKIAEELRIPEVQFWTASACSFMGYLHFSEFVRRGIVPFRDDKFLSDGTLDATIDWIPGMKDIRLKDIPSFIRNNDVLDIMFDFMGSEAENCLRAPAIIFNTFQELEHEVLDAISAKFPNLYNIGPLSSLVKHAPETKLKSLGASLWKEDSNCLQWLNQWDRNSVVYVNYGSVTVMSKEHFNEFAWGLANSKHPFLWIVRPDVVMGESAILGEEFLNEIEVRGYLTSWCPQCEVLAHPSVGVFLTHAGWNSMTEAVSEGVPVICWPFFADQQINCKYACANWGLGMEVNSDVKRDIISALVNEMIREDTGKQRRQKAIEWKERASEATDVGGSSYNDFHRFLKEVLHHQSDRIDLQ